MVTEKRHSEDDERWLPPRRVGSAPANRLGAVPKGDFYAKKFVDLEYYRQDVAAGKYENLSEVETRRLFGSPVLPIFVPLARGELMAEYEDRFIEWLRRERYPTLKELASHRDKHYERDLRIRFANLNASGVEQFVAKGEKKRPRQESESASSKRVSLDRESDASDRQRKEDTGWERDSSAERSVSPARSDNAIGHDKGEGASKKVAICEELARRSDGDGSERTSGCRLRPPSSGDATLCDVVSAHVACGCQQCLVAAVAMLSGKVSVLEKQIQEGCGCRAHARRVKNYVENTQDSDQQQAVDESAQGSDAVDSITKLLTSQPPPIEPVHQAAGKAREDDGPIVQQLASLYDQINKRVALNEKTLEISSARLATAPIADIVELASLHDEKDDLQELVHSDIEKRVNAVAKLAVYMWRRQPNELESMVSDPAASHVAHVQSLSHRMCAKIALELDEKREYTEKIRRQLDESMASNCDESKRLLVMQHLGEMLMRAEADIDDLLAQRRREISTLIHFDERIRQAIREQLAP